MRQIIPQEITKLQDKYAPYMHYVEGQGMVLASDAPLDVVEAKEKAQKWFDEHNRDNY